MFASPRRESRRDAELGVRPLREVLSRRQVRYSAHLSQQAKAFELFIRAHKVGDVVSARVIRSNAKYGIALLECGARAYIDECLDHVSGKKVEWIPVPAAGQRIQVYVRLIQHQQSHIQVSIHTFTQDVCFNLFNVGYRSKFDGTAATFALLPWEKSRLLRGGRRG